MSTKEEAVFEIINELTLHIEKLKTVVKDKNLLEKL